MIILWLKHTGFHDVGWPEFCWKLPPNGKEKNKKTSFFKSWAHATRMIAGLMWIRILMKSVEGWTKKSWELLGDIAMVVVVVQCNHSQID